MRKVAIPDELNGYKLMKGWIDKFGFWAIAFISFQPILPIEVAGIIAGTARMPVGKFLPALIAGKITKYVIFSVRRAGLNSLYSFFKTLRLSFCFHAFLQFLFRSTEISN